MACCLRRSVERGLRGSGGCDRDTPADQRIHHSGLGRCKDLSSSPIALGEQLIASGACPWWGLPVPGTRRTAGSAALVLAGAATPLRPEPALFEAMLEGWRRQQGARRLSGPLIDGRAHLVRRFREFTWAWPWQWSPGQVEAWIASGGWAHSTV